MYLPDRLYENLPFGYFLISGGLLSLGKSWLFILSAGLFYGAACITIVSRSANRRRDKRNASSVKHILPELLYEYLPYGYIAAGIFLILSFPQEWLQFLAFTLCVYALRNIMCRHAYRNRQTSHF